MDELCGKTSYEMIEIFFKIIQLIHRWLYLEKLFFAIFFFTLDMANIVMKFKFVLNTAYLHGSNHSLFQERC